MADIIDGRSAAHELEGRLRDDVARCRTEGVHPGLATIRVGEVFEAVAYERRLCALAENVGITHVPVLLPADVSEQQVLAAVAELNADPRVSGVLVLRPLPVGIEESAVFCAIAPEKDVEAVHPENAGRLAMGRPRFVPSTAASAFHLLDRYLSAAGEDLAGFYHRSLIVVVGRSANVGRPAIALAHERQATVESVDEWADKTTGIGRYTRWGDVLVVATGKPGLIRPEHVSPGCIVIDVGINPYVRDDGRTGIVGDVHFASVAPRVRAITPVPGGVGPVTDVWLLHNTVLAARNTSDTPGSRWNAR